MFNTPSHLQHYPENLTPENKKFVRDTVIQEFGPPTVISGVQTYDSPLKNITKVEPTQWFPGIRRTSTIARKIGVQPMWLKDGTRIMTTMLHVSLLILLSSRFLVHL